MAGLRGTFGTALVAVLLLGTTQPARAELGDPQQTPGQTGDGFSIAVRFSGDAAPKGSGGTAVVKVAAKCWWRTAFGPYTDAQAMLEFYDQQVASGAPDYALAAMGYRAQFEAAAKLPPGTVQWWEAFCTDPADYTDFTHQTVVTANGVRLAVTYRAFPVVNGTVTPPAPLIEPQALAEAARDVMVLPLPTVDRNPKATNPGLTGATLVNLPTWFWVTNPAAVGNPTGTRTIRAQVADGTIWAQVTATTPGLTITSPAGTTTCPPTTATRPWTPGADDTTGCTIAFTRASIGYPTGYPVTTTTTWNATWTGSGDTGGTLPTLAREVTTAVPVAESQAIVTSGG